MRTPAFAVLSGLKFVFWFITGLTFIATVLGLGGHWVWQFELASHFRLQYFVLLLVASLILLVLRHYWKSALVGSFALANMFFLAPLYIHSSPMVRDVQNLRVVSINVQVENFQYEKLFKLVQDSSPDFLVLFEVDESWLVPARELAKGFRYSRIAATDGHFGSAIFSQHPITGTELKKFGRISHYALVASLTVEGQPFHIIAAHILAPTRNAYFLMRNDHLENIANTSRLLQGPVMLIGDLNLSTWSPYFDDLIKTSGLKDSRKGFGIQTTWPVKFPLLRIPIDHCLVSPSVSIGNWVRGPDIGSDHFPIIVDFTIDGPVT